MDIVKRLRLCADGDPDKTEAADEIERLREALRKIDCANCFKKYNVIIDKIVLAALQQNGSE